MISQQNKQRISLTSHYRTKRHLANEIIDEIPVNILVNFIMETILLLEVGAFNYLKIILNFIIILYCKLIQTTNIKYQGV